VDHQGAVWVATLPAAAARHVIQAREPKYTSTPTAAIPRLGSKSAGRRAISLPSIARENNTKAAGTQG
jgi:hypothetical protein